MLKDNPPHVKHSTPHCSVLLNEILTLIVLKDNGQYLDCTLGAGGYSRAILKKQVNCFVTGIDRDPTVKKFASTLKNEFGKRFNFIQGNFADTRKLRGQQFDGILLDLGMSSMQVDNAERGFSFKHEGPLDMRMNNHGISAQEFIASASEQDLADVIYKYGEEVQSRQIASNIIKKRKISPINTTIQLADIVREKMHYTNSKIDPATKTFQAIRIYINQELEFLQAFLDHLKQLIRPGGRVLFVSFHSLEDKIVKAFLQNHSIKKIARSKYSKAEVHIEKNKWLKIITKKPVIPSRQEILFNPRSRSAKLRVAERNEEYNVIK